MHAFEVLADPTRRRVLEELSRGERSVGDLLSAVAADRPVTQPGLSQHLRVLRDHGFATSRADGPRRVYALHPDGFAEVDGWLTRYRHLWDQRLDALETEVARGRSPRQQGAEETATG